MPEILSVKDWECTCATCTMYEDCECSLERKRLFEQLETYREFFDAWWSHENGIVDFDLHADQVDRLRAATEAVAALRLPDSNPAGSHED